MKCLYCDGKLVQTKDVFHADRVGIHLTIDQLALYKCDKCGEILIGSKEVDLIQKTLTELETGLEQKAA